MSVPSDGEKKCSLPNHVKLGYANGWSTITLHYMRTSNAESFSGKIL